VGLNALIKVCGIDESRITAGTVGFVLAPRINAAGRLGAPHRAVNLLLTDDYDLAENLSLEVDEENTARKRYEEAVINDIDRIVRENPAIIYDRVLVLSGEGWHQGVIGIAASRICDKYGKPAILISIEEDGARGSGRSLEGFSLHDAIKASSEHLLTFGGHELAAGLSLEKDKIEDFKQAVNEYAENVFPEMPVPAVNIDFKLNPHAISLDTVHEIKRLEPFGVGNRIPLFGFFNMRIDGIKAVGAEKNHLRVTLSRGGTSLTAMKFRTPPESFGYRTGDTVDLAVTVESKIFMERENLAVTIRDIRFAGRDYDALISDYSIYERVRRDEALTDAQKERALPGREVFASLYKFLKAAGGFWGSTDALYFRLEDETITFCQMLVALDVLCEHELIEMTQNDNVLSIMINKTEKKVDIMESEILRWINNA